ncbi:MFS transporter [Thiofilum flexile]|uniref:MFS transporter n=1 Tax=Thiofilum flexile TaxID=125627 RepID=UPI000366F6C6|nr:MFS transporter [Thiofilum flexile]
MVEINSREFWLATWALCLGSVLVFANLHMTQPLLPLLAQEFQLTELQVSWSLTIALLMLGVSLLIYGPLSDALGRKPLMVLSLLGAVISTFAISQASSYGMLVFWRGVQGFCLGGIPAIAIAYMGDEFSRKAVAFAVGFYISANSIGGVSGRLISGFVGEHYGWAMTFIVMGVLGLVFLLLFSVLLPKSKQFVAKPLHLKQIINDIIFHLKNPVLLIAFLIAGGNFMMFIHQYSYITFVLAEEPYQLSTHQLGMLFLTYLTGSIAAALSGHISKYIPAALGMALGILLLMLGSLLTLVPQLWVIIVAFMMNSFGFFLTHSLASSWVSHHATRARASASSLYLVFYYMGASLGGLVLSPFWNQAGWLGIVLCSLVVYSLTLWGSVWLYRTKASV